MSVREGDLSGDATRPTFDAHGARRLVEALALHDSHSVVGGGQQGVPSGYIIDRPLGGGGGGRVFRAFREGSERPLALKILDRRLGQSTEALRAWRELQILQDLRLRCLPRLIDYAEYQGRLCIATEYVEGLALDDHCDAKQLARRERVELLAKVCDAVQSLHEHGVIHRDLKPSNILIDTSGEPMIIDLGIASLLAVDGSQTLTEEGRPIGTPAFMAPEQARGERGLISTRSDVYSLGATAYKVLTASTPHDTATTIHEAVRRVAQDPPRDARSLDRSVPKALAAVLGKACAARPEGRYSSAAEFGEDLRRWSRGDPVTATGAGVWRRVTRWMGRHPVATSAVGSVVVAGMVVGGTVIGVWWWHLKPSHLVLNDESSFAKLVARSGHELWSISGTEGVDSVFACLAHSPADSRRSVLVSLVKRSSARPYGVVRFWYTDSLEAAYWDSSREQLALRPPRPPQVSDNSYLASDVAVADLLPALPGDEVVVIYNQILSPSALVVYDLKGNVLSQLWHHGSLGPLYIVRNSVFVSGLDNQESATRNAINPDHPIRPRCLFAFTPEHHLHLPIINESTTVRHCAVRWYKHLFARKDASIDLTRMRIPFGAVDELEVSLAISGCEGGWSMLVGLDGEVRRCTPSDAIRHSLDQQCRTTPTLVAIQRIIE